MDDLNIMEHPIFFMDDLEKIRATPMTLGLPSDSKMGRPGISTTVGSRGLPWAPRVWFNSSALW